MGVYGCVGTRGVRGTQKQGKKGEIMVSQVRIWDLCPGKFPRTSCFAKKQKNMNRALRMGAHGLTWVRQDAFIRREAKARQKAEQMREQGMFYNVCQRPKKTEIQQGRSRMTRGDLGGEIEGN